MPRTKKTGDVKVVAPAKKRAKQSASKKSSGEASCCRECIAASGEQCFWVNNGPVLADMRDLFRALDDMTDAQFKHHVSGGKNDFALWVRDVLCHGACADRLVNAKTRTAAKKALASCYTTCC